MNKPVQPDYGNWVSGRRITHTFLAAAVFGAAAAALFVFCRGTLETAFAALLTFIAVLSLLSAWYFVRARKMFSYSGGGVRWR